MASKNFFETIVSHERKYNFKWTISNFSTLTETLCGHLILVDSTCFYVHAGCYDDSFNVVVLSVFNNACTVKIYDCEENMFLESSNVSNVVKEEEFPTEHIKSHLYDNYKNVCRVLKLSSSNKIYHKLKQLPSKQLVMIFQIVKLDNPNSISRTKIESQDIRTLQQITCLDTLNGYVEKFPSSNLSEFVSLYAGQELEKIHKTILCAQAPAFMRKLTESMREQDINSFNIEIPMPVVRKFTTFLYTGRLEDCDFPMLCDLYHIASKYKVDKLVNACVDQLMEKLDEFNACQILVLAITNNDESLQTKVISFIEQNFNAVVSTKGWEWLMRTDLELCLRVYNSVKK